MSPPLKASFCRPVPGSALGEQDPKQWPEELPSPEEATGKDKERIKEALENFAVIALEPVFVDLYAFHLFSAGCWSDVVCSVPPMGRVRLKVMPNERFQYTKETDGSWKEVAVVP